LRNAVHQSRSRRTRGVDKNMRMNIIGINVVLLNVLFVDLNIDLAIRHMVV
jgi:hypothetical protein